jgi:hypothetical protein
VTPVFKAAIKNNFVNILFSILHQVSAVSKPLFSQPFAGGLFIYVEKIAFES